MKLVSLDTVSVLALSKSKKRHKRAQEVTVVVEDRDKVYFCGSVVKDFRDWQPFKPRSNMGSLWHTKSAVVVSIRLPLKSVLTRIVICIIIICITNHCNCILKTVYRERDRVEAEEFMRPARLSSTLRDTQFVHRRVFAVGLCARIIVWIDS